MNILDISIILFVIMESSNVIILYFKPEFKYGNGVSVFNNYELSKTDENAHLFVKYLVNWVAGVKLIFLFLLLVILFLGNNTLKIFAVIAMIISIASYFWRLAPLIKKLDDHNMITPKGYSKMLNINIIVFILMFAGALISYLIFANF